MKIVFRFTGVSVDEFYEMTTGETKFTLLDVRAPGEYKSSHIEGAINIPVPELRTRYGELSKELPIAILCGSGHRSSLGASILEQHGFKNLLNVAGGMTGYNAAGYGPECHLCVLPHGPQDKNE